MSGRSKRSPKKLCIDGICLRDITDNRRHSGHALDTFNYLHDAAEIEQTKCQILFATTKSLLTHSNTGYSDAANDSTLNQIVEIVGGLEQKEGG